MKKTILILILMVLSFNASTAQAQIAQCAGSKTTTLPQYVQYYVYVHLK